MLKRRRKDKGFKVTCEGMIIVMDHRIQTGEGETRNTGVRGKIILITQLKTYWVVMAIEQIYQASPPPKFTENYSSVIFFFFQR